MMFNALPSSVLFCCDYNAVRSPMAEGIMKMFFGDSVYVQSAGVYQEMEIDGYAIAVCQEIGIELSRHRTRTMKEMSMWGDEITSYELIIALSQKARDIALKSAEYYDVKVEYWPDLDPPGFSEDREDKLIFYRKTRDDIRNRILYRFRSNSNLPKE